MSLSESDHVVVVSSSKVCHGADETSRPQSAVAHHGESDGERELTTTGALLSGVVDNVRTMMEQERTVYAYRNYRVVPDRNYAAVPNRGESRNSSSVEMASTARATVIDPAWREQICDWSMGVVDHFDFSRETVAVALSLLDRYLATLDNSTAVNSSTTLLVAITTLHIAIKIHEAHGNKVRLETLCKLSRGLFVRGDIERMEWTVLQALGWHVHPPTSIGFVSYLMQFVPEEDSPNTRHEVYTTARYLAELSVCKGYFVDRHASDVAFAAVLLAMDARGVTHSARSSFEKTVAGTFRLHTSSKQVLEAYEVLREMYAASLGTTTEELATEDEVTMAQQSGSPSAVEEFSPTWTSPSTVLIEDEEPTSLRRDLDIGEDESPSAKRSRTYSTAGQPASLL